MRISDWSSDVCSSDLHSYLSVNAQLIEKYLVTHFCVAKELRPANHFHVKTDIPKPSEPPEAVGHGGKLLFKFQPLPDLGRQVAHNVAVKRRGIVHEDVTTGRGFKFRSEEHTSELQSLMRISYAVFC